MTFKQKVESRVVRTEGGSSFDKDDNEILFKMDGVPVWYIEYNEQGKVVHFYSNEVERIYEYDERNNRIFAQRKQLNKPDIEKRWKFDDKNRVISFQTSSGEGYVREYDDHGNVIYIKNNDGFETWKEYDENNWLLYDAHSGRLGDFQYFDQMINPRLVVIVDRRDQAKISS